LNVVMNYKVVEYLTICYLVKFHDFSPNGLREMIFLRWRSLFDKVLDRTGFRWLMRTLDA
jgi:hypothetical protein